MQFYAITYPQNSTIHSRNILGLGNVECYTGIYICALQKKEKNIIRRVNLWKEEAGRAEMWEQRSQKEG